ncbi:MAG: ADP-ribosylglycohydrolase family protein [Candidatus Bathyarchaeota archaeon]|nr:MAG: ADP-ribosylglycohydrolase family protein [Candidatus Bathyarchaeota archaeon]
MNKELDILWAELERLAPRPDFPFHEPSDLEGIREARPEGPRETGYAPSGEELYDRTHGAWLGRCSGCLLGKPVEGWTRERIESYLRLAETYPLDDYFPLLTPLQEGYRLHPSYRESVQGRIEGMPRDDDIDYTIIGLHVLEEHGSEFTTDDVAGEWLTHIPYRMVNTAERAAYRNLVNGLPPRSAASHRNPYREWIGAQIRADIWGYVTPGMPELGAEYAHRDASLSHVKNGMYGEMFVSAMVSAAFATDDVVEIIETGLSEIPGSSRLAEAAVNVLGWSEECGDWRGAWDRVMEEYGGFHTVHTINNAALVLLGLLYGGGDFEKTIVLSVMGGLDTDCNGATAGSIIGAVLGAEALPRKWIDPLDDRVRSAVTGFTDMRISDLARRTCAVREKIRERHS